MAVGDLQSYSGHVLLFQPKIRARLIGSLALSAWGRLRSALTLVPGVLFGVILFLYLLAAVVTFGLLLLYGNLTRQRVGA